MPIMLTCTCGQQQAIANTMAGKTFACVGCGKAMHVPAMGILATARPKPQVATPSARRPALLMFVVGALLLLSAGGGGWLAWALTRETPTGLVPIAQAEEEVKPRVEPVASEPETGKPALIESVRPEKKEPPPAIMESVPRESPTPVADPIKPTLEPAKAVIEPGKPKEPPPPMVVEKQPLNVIEPLKLVWKLKADEVFFQELIVTQRPTYKVQGLQVAAFLQYRLVSRFTVKQRNDDGSLIVEQKIESAKLLQADDLTKPGVEPALAKMPGVTYTLTFSPKMDVTKFDSGPGAANVMQLAGGLGMQMTSLIDRDGWKELNQSTFFQMNDPLKPNARWSKPLAHSWGSLGSWNGQTNYQYAGQEKDLHKITYGLQLAYKAPKAGGAGLMAINGANFQAPVAGGYLVFDAARGRVIAAEERFRVKGIINVNLLGQNTGVEIDEDQHFAIRIHEKIDAVK